MDWLARYANWWGVRGGRRADIIWYMTSLSKHFMMFGASATGWWSLRQDGALKHSGDSGVLEAHGDDCLAQRGVDVNEF